VEHTQRAWWSQKLTLFPRKLDFSAMRLRIFITAQNENMVFMYNWRLKTTQPIFIITLYRNNYSLLVCWVKTGNDAFCFPVLLVINFSFIEKGQILTGKLNFARWLFFHIPVWLSIHRFLTENQTITGILILIQYTSWEPNLGLCDFLFFRNRKSPSYSLLSKMLTPSSRVVSMCIAP
jgi:hypothetical protein